VIEKRYDDYYWIKHSSEAIGHRSGKTLFAGVNP
jgi:hypothetical protein